MLLNRIWSEQARMRTTTALVLILATAIANASASSIVAIGDSMQGVGSSTVVLGETADVVAGQQVEDGSTIESSGTMLKSPSVSVAAQPAGTPTPSIVIIGEPGRGVIEDRIAEVAKPRPQSGRPMTPMLIRGGIVGDAIARPIASSGRPTEASTPLALDPNDKGTPSKRKALKRQAERQQAMEQQAPAAPPPEPPTTTE